MTKTRLTPKIVIGALLAIFFGISLIYRIDLPYNQIFVGDWVKFSSIDAYYHMRLVDNLVHNFPALTGFDPYFIYPGGINVVGVHFTDWLLAGFIWIIGLGSPTQHTIDVVSVYFPAILAALTVIPVYFIGKTLFNRWAGIIAAALIAILPGEFIGRSILGFNDTPIAETLLTATAMMFLILALKTAGQRQLTFNHFIKRDWSTIVRPLVYSLLAGIFLGLFLITWFGGMLFVFIIALYFIIQFIINHLQHKSSDHLGIISFILYFVALIIFLPFSPTRDLFIAMVIAIFIPLVLSGVSRLVAGRGLRPIYYPLGLLGIAIVFVAIFYAISPNIINSMLDKFQMVFTPGGAMGATTLEMQPFLSPHGSFSTAIAWGNFTTSFFLFPSDWFSGNVWFPPGFGLVAFIILIWLVIRHRGHEQQWLLFLVWTLIILVATLTQRRFAYYFVVNIALLSAYISWQIIWRGGLRKLMTTPEEITAESKESGVKAKKEKGESVYMYHANVVLSALAIVVVFLAVLYPNIIKAKEVASVASFAPTDAWQSSLLWMRENTPEPLGDPDAYYRNYEAMPPGEKYDYPESAYGVTSWWDYGYWIMRTAQRIPNANPSQAPGPIRQVAAFFLSQEVPPTQETQEIIDELNSSYVIIDQAMVTSKFWAIVNWAELSLDKYSDIYYIPTEEQLIGKQLYYPEYYHAMCVRLYNFDGKAVNDVKPTVITYENITGDDGQTYKVLTQVMEFPSYQDALDYLENEGTANQRIVGVDPFTSPIPLEALEDYQIIYSSEYLIVHKDLALVPELKVVEFPLSEVKIFEYLGD